MLKHKIRRVTTLLTFLCLHLPVAAAPQNMAPPGVINTACQFCPETVGIAGGQFQMGDVGGTGDDDEQPIKTIAVNAFAIGRFEVTFAEFDHYATKTDQPLPEDLGWGRDNRPVINVSWQQAVAYTEWLSEQTGRKYRLPSEAEWQFAALAGRDPAQPHWQDPAEVCKFANHADASTTYRWRNIACRDGFATTTRAVGRYEPNAFGLHDMHGNVYEWVQDCYAPSLEKIPADGSALEQHSCKRRVMKGGSWYNAPINLRAANRSSNDPEATLANLGFRVVLELSAANERDNDRPANSANIDR